MTSSSSSSLSPILPILNAFNHRHHNQHRLAHWWPVFRIFRRSVRALVDDLASSRRRHDAASPPPPPPRAVWLSKHFISRAYIAFSQLAADNQHAPLGLLLLAILSRTHAVLAQLLDQPTVPPPVSVVRPNDVSQDKGVAVARQEPPPPTDRVKSQATAQRSSKDELNRDATEPPKAKSKEMPSKEKKKKKKAKGDALASLFGSL